MYPAIASAIQTIGTLLLSASQTLPVSQLSVVAWVILAASRSITSRDSFNTTER